MTDDKQPTHIAYGKKYYSKKLYTWLEIGKGRYDPATGEFHGMQDRTIIGGFSGYTCYVPLGKPAPAIEPERPGEDSELL